MSRHRFYSCIEVERKRFPTVQDVLRGDARLPYLRQWSDPNLLKRVGGRIEDALDARLAKDVLQRLFALPRFENRTGYVDHETRVYAIRSRDHSILVLSNMIRADVAIVMDLEGQRFTVGGVHIGDGRIVSPSHGLTIEAVMESMQPKARRKEPARTTKPPSFLDRLAGVHVAAMFGTMLLTGFLTSRFGFAMSTTMVLMAAVIVTWLVVRDIRTAPSDGPSERHDPWTTITADLDDAEVLRARYENVGKALAGSLDLDDISALSMMEGTLGRISASHSDAMCKIGTGIQHRDVVVRTRSALDAVIAGGEARIAARAAKALEHHRTVSEFALAHSMVDGTRPSLH